jgi:hypothetical protein
VFRFSLQLLSEIFFILRISELDVIKNVYLLSCTVPYFYRILIKIKFSGQIFDKYCNIKFHENPSGGSRLVPYGQTDGWTDITRLIAAFHNFADAPKNNRVIRKKYTSRKNVCETVYFKRIISYPLFKKQHFHMLVLLHSFKIFCFKFKHLFPIFWQLKHFKDQSSTAETRRM